MSAFFHCAAFCGWEGDEPKAVVDLHGRLVREECPRCAAEVSGGMSCSTCHQAVAVRGMDDCAACAVAYMLHVDSSSLDVFRRVAAGTRDLRVVEAEIERQLSGLIAA